MALILMSLGDALFYRASPTEETPSFETINRDITAMWPAQGRLGRDQALQFTGPGEEVISIHGRLFPYQFGGLATMDLLRDLLRQGQPYALTIFAAQPYFSSSGDTFSGTQIGNYVIRSLKKESSLYTASAIPMKVDFTMELVLYGDDIATDNFTPDSTSSSTSSTDTSGSSSTGTSSGSSSGTSSGSSSGSSPPSSTPTPSGQSFDLWT